MRANNKKIIIFGLALLILAGIIVVILKGFNVSLDLQAHNTLKFVFDQKYEKSDVDKICKEVFKSKKYKIKTVEVFTDAVYIISPTITDNEKEQLLEKLDNLYVSDENKSEDVIYETTEEGSTLEDIETSTIYDKLVQGKDYDFYSDSKVRIRDIVRPYIIPSLISALVIIIYIAIRYKELNNKKPIITVLKTLGEMIVIILILLSIIAIFRIHFTSTLIPILMFIILVCLVVRLSFMEKELKVAKR